MSIPILRLPELKRQGRPNPYLRVKNLKNWLMTLPRIGGDTTAEQIIEQLERINLGNYPLHERIALLDTLRPLIRQFLPSLKQITKTAMLPLSAREQRAYQQIQQLLSAMATGYKLVLNDALQLENPREHDQLLLREAIYLTLQYLTRQIVEAFLIYAPVPEGVWQEIHTLYRYAEEHELQNLPVDDPYPDFSLPTHYTIDLAYKRILLLTLAEPYHMVQGEADDIYYLVSAWTGACHLRAEKSPPLESDYAVDLNSDAPPCYFVAKRLPNAHQARKIDIEEVKKRLDVHLQRLLIHSLDAIDHNEHQSMVERRQRDMLLRLSSAWHAELSRQQTRQPSGKKIHMAAGLSASHYYITGGHDFTPALDELKLKEDEIEPAIYLTAYEVAQDKDRFHKNTKYPIRPWWQFNNSESGTAICCTTNCGETHVRVGEVVAYQDSARPASHWRVGDIRWLKTDLKGGLEIGIMNLASSAVPIAVKALKGQGWGTEYFRGLLIPKQVSLLQTRSVLIPATVYDVHSELSVSMKNRLFYIRLTSLLSTTTEFSQFTFEVLTEEPIPDGQIFVC